MSLLDELKTWIEPSPIAFLLTDLGRPDDPIVAANAAFYGLTRYGRDSILGRNCRFLQGPESEEEARTVLRAAIADRRPAIAQMLNYRSDGSTFRNGITIAPIDDEDGRPAFYLGSQVDLGPEAPDSWGGRRRRAAALVRRLARREAEVLGHLMRGHRSKQIAYLMSLSEATVRMYRARILDKLAVRSSAEAIRIAVEGGL